MPPTFIFPPKLHALEAEAEAETEDSFLSVDRPVDVSSLRSSDVEQFVKGLSFDLSDRELFCIQDQDVFDRVYSVVKAFTDLPPPCKFNIVECLRSNFSVLLPNVDSISRNSLRNGGNAPDPLASDSLFSHRNAFKIYTFFLVQILLAEHSNGKSTNSSKVLASAKKKSPMNSWNWETQRARILSLIANSLELNLSLLFGSSDPDDNYLAFIAKNALSFFENAILLKDSNAKDALCRIVATCSTKYHYTAQSCASILHLLHKYDFVVIPMVDAVALAEKKFADGSLATSLIREIGRTSPKDYVKDAAGAENIGRFLVEIADRLPKLISSNVGILVPHFGGESYKIRNALIGVLGKLVAKAFKDVEGEVSSKSVRLRAKQAMLEILLERCRDVAAYTRSRALQVWSELCEQHAISIGFWNEVAAVAAGRLEDKSAIVRKSALNLLIMMLQHNPFGPQLQIASFEATLNEYKEKLNELQPEENDVSTSDKMPSDLEPCDGRGEVDHVGSEASDTNVPEHPDSVTDSYLSQAEERTLPKDNSLPDIGNLEQTKVLVASLEAGLTFAKSVASVMPVLVQLMASSSATDVENTILLLMSCRQFQIEGSETCLRQMLPLVFSQDKSIFEAVENAFTTIYITKNHLETSKNLLSLAVTSNIGDLAALEYIISALVSKGDISSGVISALWDFFCFNTSKTTAEQSRGALSILCMAAKSSSKVLNAHLQDIIDIGFGRWAKVDPLLARTACIALQRLPEEEKKKIMTGATSRLFGILESLITGFWLPDSLWYGAADKAIGAIYMLHPTPEAIAAKLIKKTLMSVFESGDTNDLQQGADNSVNDIPSVAQVGKLSRYLYVTSHVAMNQLLYIECCVKKIQKQKVAKEKMAAENNHIDESVSDVADASKNTSINAELGISASEDAKLDSLFTKAEKEIISWDCVDKNLIGCCAPFLSKLCRNFSLMQKYPDLQASAMLALCRFMIIDADFCEANLQLLFTVVDNSPSEAVRSNCTIALGDLAVRFPNLVEPWTENMYSRLRDPSVSVRKNAVLVLSHLILNDMMKVKGHIYEMTMRLEDEDERISSLAKLFFTELSKKGNNPIYNLLPDILGKLFNQNLKRESFCNIMQFLIGSIKKDKQMEGLVEKLCNRFCGITDCSQWECTSYCLSQLTFTEKGMKKLMESFKTYEHALSEASVLEHFKSIISKAKKFAKPDMKACVEEFEQKLNKFHADRKEQEVTAKNAQAHSQKAGNLDKFIVSTEVKEGVLDPEAAEVSEDATDGEVLDPCGEEAPNCNDIPESNTCEPNNQSTTSSAVSQLEDDQEVVQPLIDVSISKARKVKGKSQGESAQLEDDNEQVQPFIDVSISKARKAQGKSREESVSTSVRRSTRSRR